MTNSEGDMTMVGALSFDDLKAGDYVKARVGNERLWFEYLSPVENNAALCRMVSMPLTGVLFDGRCTLDRAWIMEISRKVPSALRIVGGSDTALSTPEGEAK